MRPYETTIIIDGQLNDDAVKAMSAKYEQLVKDNGGEVRRVEHWGKKRLAYEIQKRQYGYYTHMRFEAPGSIVRILQRDFDLNEAVLRYLTILMDRKALAAEKANQEAAARATELAAEAARQAEAEKAAAAAEAEDAPAEPEAEADSEAEEVKAEEAKAEEAKAEETKAEKAPTASEAPDEATPESPEETGDSDDKTS